MACLRYPLEYPHQPLIVRATTSKGLTATDIRSLTKLLKTSAAEHARDQVVAGFSIADTCQEFLLTKNTPEAAKNDRTVHHLSASVILAKKIFYHTRFTHSLLCRQMVRCGTVCLKGIAYLKQMRRILQTPLIKLHGASPVKHMVETCLAVSRCQKPG